MAKYILVGFLFVFSSQLAHAQNVTLTITVTEEESDEELIGATIFIEELSRGEITDTDGKAVFTNIEPGAYTIEVAYLGYEEQRESITVTTENFTFYIELSEAETELDEVVIRTTRGTRTIQNVPTRIEYIGAEELEEKAIMNASNISMVLRESTGIQIQQTSLSSGNRSIRIQGLDGRYTQMLRDGFPLYGGFSNGLSIMQIPPLDLKAFEIVKGSSSTLYGGGAIAGLVNLISKRPSVDQDLDILVSQTHIGGTTGNIFYSTRGEKAGLTVYGSGHFQLPYSPDNDGFTNLPKTGSFSINPKLFIYPTEKSTLWMGVNTTWDSRKGGDISLVKNGADATHTYFENNKSNRVSTQLAYEVEMRNDQFFDAKNSISFFGRNLSEPGYSFTGKEINTFTELNYRKNKKRADFIAGLNLYSTNFQEQDQVVPRDQNDLTVGVFANSTIDISSAVIMELGLRGDYAVDWGFLPLPRISLLWKANRTFSMRIGGGMGYKTPDMFTEEAAMMNFEGVMPIDKDVLEVEKSYGANVDFNIRTAIGEKASLSINQLFYATAINDPLLLEMSGVDEYSFINADGYTLSIGSETNMKIKVSDFRVFLNYAFIDTRQRYLDGNPLKPLTPQHNAGTVLMYESESWRIGYEVYYTGNQMLSNGDRTKGFVTMGLLVQKHFKWASPYVNFENFTDRRQSRYSPEVSGTLQDPVFEEIYAPTDGFVFTAGVYIMPFGREADDD